MFESKQVIREYHDLNLSPRVTVAPNRISNLCKLCFKRCSQGSNEPPMMQGLLIKWQLVKSLAVKRGVRSSVY